MLDAILALVGTAASIAGALATVHFSRDAKKAAEAAKIAAFETRMQVSRVDIIADLNKALTQLDDLSRRLEVSSWEIVAERSTAVRLLVSPISGQAGHDFSNAVMEGLADLVSQMRILSRVADKANFGTGKAPDIPRMRVIIDDQKETIALALSEIKQKLGESDGPKF